MENPTLRTTPRSTSDFLAHLDYASAVVATWPEWKQNLLGGTTMESTNPKDKIGKSKPSIHLIPPVALIEEAVVFGLGASKYGPYNWRTTTVSAEVYVSAALRHILSWQDRQDIDPESGSTHLAHARACLAILIDAESEGRLVDDRPPGGTAAALIIRRTTTGRTSGVGETTTAVGVTDPMYHPDLSSTATTWTESMGDLIPVRAKSSDEALAEAHARLLDQRHERENAWRAGDEHDTMSPPVLPTPYMTLATPGDYSYFDDDEVSKPHGSTVTVYEGDSVYDSLPLPPEDPTERWVHSTGFANKDIAYIERDGHTLTWYRHDGTISSIWQDPANSFSANIAEGSYRRYHGPHINLNPAIGAAFEKHCRDDSDACGCGVPFLTADEMQQAVTGWRKGC